MQSLQSVLSSVKSRRATTPSAVQNLGASVHDKLQNIVKGGKVMISHAYFPEGSVEKAAAMKETFRRKFGFEVPEALVSFYEIFDGFELRLVAPEDDLKDLLEEHDWLKESYSLPGDYADFTLEEWRSGKYNGVLQELSSFFEVADLGDPDQVKGRTTLPEEEGILYYGDHTHIIDNYGAKTIIPPAERLFDDGNRSGEADGVELYYFDFFTFFNQVVIGISKGKADLYQVKYGYGELEKIDEDIPTYLKKVIIRG